MVAVLLLVTALLPGVSDGATTPADPADLRAYHAAVASAGRDAEANIKLALWCESHGLKAERLKHLAVAVLLDPKNASARGMMGLVAYGGQWKRPEAVAEKVKADETLTARLAEYNGRRARASATADAQWSLALWCEQNGLTAEARAHFTAVTRLDPARDAAWKRLGCKNVNGRWVTEAQLTAEKEEVEAQKKADKYWKPLLTRWRGWLKDKNKREAAEKALAGVTDPRAVPSVCSVFVTGDTAHHAQAVQLLGQIDVAGSSRALAILAAFSDSPEVRRASMETLKRRDPREFAGLLVALLRDPIKYEVRPVGGPGSPGVLFVEGNQFNIQRNYGAPALPQQVRVFTDAVPFDPFSPANLAAALHVIGTGTAPIGDRLIIGPHGALQRFGATVATNPGGAVQNFTEQARLRDFQIGMNVVAVHSAAVASQNQLQQDVAQIDTENRRIAQTNARANAVLMEVTGVDQPADRAQWSAWFANQAGYVPPSADSSPKQTLVQSVTPFRPLLNPSTSTPLGLSTHSCFGAGTLVRTLDGSCPIESIQVGDRVLTQDVRSGALGYDPVTVVYHNPPSPTFLVRVGADTIVSSPFHRFWVAGKGWILARDLKGGESLRLLDGPARVEAVECGPVQLVYNLDVAEAHDFFAGSTAALVHDNTLPETRLAPFDAAPALTGAAPAR